eukprot:scaffold107365_cov36-Phaeocystis_antarctica.AAC.1
MSVTWAALRFTTIGGTSAAVRAAARAERRRAVARAARTRGVGGATAQGRVTRLAISRIWRRT